MKETVLIIVMLTVLTVSSGCSSAVYFRTNPEGATLRINGIQRGKTPCAVQLNWTTFKKFDIRLEKEGYMPYLSELQKEPKWGYIIIDSLFLWPLLLFNSYGPKAIYSFNLTPVSSAQAKELTEHEQREGLATKSIKSGNKTIKPGKIRIYESITDKPRMACLEFRKGNEDADKYTTTIQEMFSTGFVESKKFSIIEREQIEKILKEKQFARTEEVNAETARMLGKVLGVDYLLIGSVSKLDDTFEVDARLVEVETGETKIASSGSCTNTSELRTMVYGIVNDLNQKFTGE